MILSFRDRLTEALYRGERPRSVAREIAVTAQRKLTQLAVANRLGELRVPPGNRLERLAGNRNGQWSIRVNDQWRICFTWSAEGADDVEFCDYH